MSPLLTVFRRVRWVSIWGNVCKKNCLFKRKCNYFFSSITDPDRRRKTLNKRIVVINRYGSRRAHEYEIYVSIFVLFFIIIIRKVDYVGSKTSLNHRGAPARDKVFGFPANSVLTLDSSGFLRFRVHSLRKQRKRMFSKKKNQYCFAHVTIWFSYCQHRNEHFVCPRILQTFQF